MEQFKELILLPAAFAITWIYASLAESVRKKASEWRISHHPQDCKQFLTLARLKWRLSCSSPDIVLHFWSNLTFDKNLAEGNKYFWEWYNELIIFLASGIAFVVWNFKVKSCHYSVIKFSEIVSSCLLFWSL